MATSIHNNSSSQEASLWIIAEFKRSQCILDFASRRNCLFQRHSCRTLFDPTDSSTVVFLHRLLSSSDGFFVYFTSCKHDFLGRIWCTRVVETFAFSCSSGKVTLWCNCSLWSLLLTQIILQTLSGPFEQELAHPHLQEIHWAAPLELIVHPQGRVNALDLQSDLTAQSSGERSISSTLCSFWWNR